MLLERTAPVHYEVRGLQEASKEYAKSEMHARRSASKLGWKAVRTLAMEMVSLVPLCFVELDGPFHMRNVCRAVNPLHSQVSHSQAL